MDPPPDDNHPLQPATRPTRRRMDTVSEVVVKNPYYASDDSLIKHQPRLMDSIMGTGQRYGIGMSMSRVL